MPDLLQDVRLRLRVGHLVAPDDGLLLEHLHRIDVGRPLLAHQHDLAEAALPKHLEKFEVLERHLWQRIWDGDGRLGSSCAHDREPSALRASVDRSRAHTEWRARAQGPPATRVRRRVVATCGAQVGIHRHVLHNLHRRILTARLPKLVGGAGAAQLLGRLGFEEVEHYWTTWTGRGRIRKCRSITSRGDAERDGPEREGEERCCCPNQLT